MASNGWTLALVNKEILGIFTKILIQRSCEDEPRSNAHLSLSNHKALGIMTKIVGAKLRWTRVGSNIQKWHPLPIKEALYSMDQSEISVRILVISEDILESWLIICEEASLGIDQGTPPWSIPKETSSQIFRQDSARHFVTKEFLKPINQGCIQLIKLLLLQSKKEIFMKILSLQDGPSRTHPNPPPTKDALRILNKILWGGLIKHLVLASTFLFKESLETLTSILVERSIQHGPNQDPC